jgi:adenosylcobyric acid synthase
MNPLLLKPKSDDISQLIVHGKVARDVSAREYFLSNQLQNVKLEAIRTSLDYLRSNYDLIIAEGGGSCAEPNLRGLDVVNMGLAEILEPDVYIVADVDKGGSIASLLGSLQIMELTTPTDLRHIRGFILNKFRGDPAILRSGVEFLERQSGIRVIGIVPLLHHFTLQEEDRVKVWPCDNPEVDVAIIYLPHTANASDFDDLASEDGVRVRYIRTPEELGRPDAIIIPGTKNTVWDLEYLRRTGMANIICLEAEKDTPVIGICGGFQMMGRFIADPEHIESEIGSVAGLGLLDVDFAFERTKTVTNRDYRPSRFNPFAAAGGITGYEIHCGTPQYGDCRPLFEYDGGRDGALHPSKAIWGTFIHDLFSNPKVTRELVNLWRVKKGLAPLQSPLRDRYVRADAAYEQLAGVLEKSLSL